MDEIKIVWPWQLGVWWVGAGVAALALIPSSLLAGGAVATIMFLARYI